MRGFRQTKESFPKPAIGRSRGCRSLNWGGGKAKGVCLFLSASPKQTTPLSCKAKASRGHGRGSRCCVGCSPCPRRLWIRKLSSVPDLDWGNFSYRLAVSLILLPLLVGEKLLCFQHVGPSQAAGCLQSFTRAHPRFFSWEKLGSSMSQRFLFLFGIRENFLKFFSSSGLICSLSLGCREVITVAYYLVKDP
jgi:hypothetical protein